MGGLSGFWTVYLKKKRSKTAQDLNDFEQFILKKNAQKPRKTSRMQEYLVV